MKKIISLLMAVTMSAAIFSGCAKKETIVINSAEDLKGKTIGVQGGTTGGKWVTANITSDIKFLKEYKSGMDAALELKSGVLDVVVLDELPAKSIVSKNDDLKILDVNLGDQESYAIAVKKGNTELVDSINKTLKSMKDSGEYQALADAFIPPQGDIVVPKDIVSNSDKVLKMGTNAEFPPFEYVDGDKIVGFDISLSQKIAADYGAKLEVVNMQFDSLISALSAGSIDFVAAGMSIDEERKKNVDFSDEYFTAKQVVIVRK